MEESEQERQHREDTLRVYQALKEALKIIGEVSTQTVSTPTPPPITNEWIPNDPPPPSPKPTSQTTNL